MMISLVRNLASKYTSKIMIQFGALANQGLRNEFGVNEGDAGSALVGWQLNSFRGAWGGSACFETGIT